MTGSLEIVTVVAKLAIAVEALDIKVSPASHQPTVVPVSLHTFTPLAGMFVDVKLPVPVMVRLVTVLLELEAVMPIVKPSSALLVELG